VRPDVLGLSPGTRLAVVSPHLDDAVLSLGATIARAARAGVPVVVATALACDPESAAETKGWDARAGFATEGEAARARREEDAAACAVLGATPVWLPFGSVDYERHGDETDVAAAVVQAIADAEAVMLPGTPLSHPDHDWLVRALLARGFSYRRVGFYAEQPYSARSTVSHDVAHWLGAPLELEQASASMRDLLAKRRALRCYRSQLPLLALGGSGLLNLERHLYSEARAGGEAFAWLPAGAPTGRP